jgi:hypothetical protein
VVSEKVDLLIDLPKESLHFRQDNDHMQIDLWEIDLSGSLELLRGRIQLLIAVEIPIPIREIRGMIVIIRERG